MELYLVRHGETESNRQKRYKGWTESSLSEKGIWQAEQAAAFLSSKGIDAVYCSDLERAQNTARFIGKRTGIIPEVTPLLREIHFGRWEGMTYNEIESSWGEEIHRWIDDPFCRSAPGGETLKTVCTRMQTFLNYLCERYINGQHIAAVSHGGSIRALLYQVMSLEPQSFWEIKIDNASVTKLRKVDNQFEVVYYNHTVHLECEAEKEGSPDGI